MPRNYRRERAGDVMNHLTDGLMAAMLVFMPLAFGGLETWAQEAWFVLIALLGGVVLVRPIVDRETPLVASWAFVPILLFVLLAGVQLLPIRGELLNAVSPGTLRLKEELLGRLAGPQTLTFYPFATVRQLRIVLAGAAVFGIVLQAYRTPERIRRLLTLIISAGLAVAVVAAYHDLTQARLIYGHVPIGHKNAAPFLNYSHFSQFMNLSTGAAVALILMTLAEWREGGRGTIDWRYEWQRPGKGWLWAALALAVVAPVLVLVALSRMGVISMIVAGGVMACLFGWRGGLRRVGRSKHRRRRSGAANGTFFLLTYGVGVLAVLLVVGFESVFSRLEELQGDQATSVTTRWQILNDLVAVYRQFPVFGTGLGTHEFVYPLFSRAVDSHLFTHAENEYAQLLEECGGIGLLLAVAFIAIVVAAFVRTIWKPTRPVQFVAYGAGFGLLAILLHSFTDFGQHMPANATLTATFAAVLMNLSAANRPRAEPQSLKARSHIWAGATLAGFAVVAGWLIYRGDVARRADMAYRDARAISYDLDFENWQGDDAEASIKQLLTRAGQAAELEPRSVTYAYWLNAWRWQAVSASALDPATRQLTLNADMLAFAKRIADDLDGVRPLCPTYGPPLCVAGQIRKVALDDPAGNDQIRLAYRLTPYDRVVCYAYGTLASQEHDFESATPALDRYIDLGGLRWHVVDAYLLANRPDLAFKTASADRWNLHRLAGGLEKWPGQETLVARCRELEIRLLVEESDRPDAKGQVLAECAGWERQNGKAQDAIMWYQRAVDTDYARVDWRLGLAQSQLAVGQTEEAKRNLQVCLRLRPQWAEAQALLEVAGRRFEPAKDN
ncbi:MAG: O-antigen ligase family protein [Tepidisphaeraceae bacterium]